MGLAEHVVRMRKTRKHRNTWLGSLKGKERSEGQDVS